MHSTASDGRCSPSEVVAAVAREGLTGFALTDHDTGAGLAEARVAAAAAGLDLLPGVEISTTVAGSSVHLLGYGDITAHPALAPVLAATVGSRHTRVERLVERLAVDLPELTYRGVLARVPPGTTPGRPHVADELAAIGAVPNRDAAFAHYLAEGGPYYVGYESPETAEAVRLVLAAGGVPVLAHPASRSGAEVLDDDTIGELAELGLAGLEVDHRDHGPTARSRLRGLAAELGLLVTGSSDFHGEGRASGVGTDTTPPDTVEEIRSRLVPVA